MPQSDGAEGGMAAVQIAQVAARADIAAGTVYRYFPSKTNLVAEAGGDHRRPRARAMRAAAAAAPGPLSALAAAIATSPPARSMPAGWPGRCSPSRSMPRSTPCGSNYRQSLAAELETRIKAAIGGRISRSGRRVAAPAIVGALIEGLIGPLAPSSTAMQRPIARRCRR